LRSRTEMDPGSVEIGFAPDSDQALRIKKLATWVLDDISKMYQLGDELGRGRFSVVQHATHLKENQSYAVKVVENKSLADDENLEALETEIDILRQLDHPYIVSLKEVVVTSKDTYIVMELLSGGELFNRIVENGSFTEAEAASLFAQILLSMEYLHSLNIVHRDVKPENILYLTEGANQIKLIDFGYAGMWSEEKPLTGLCGTPDYVAPEVLTWYEDDEHGTPYGKGSDLWSLGVLLYVILSGCSPFSADEEEAILALVQEAKYEFHEAEWKDISPEAKDLISQLLMVKPEERLTMQQLLDHSWLKSAIATSRVEIEAAKVAKQQQQAAKPSGDAPATRTAGNGAVALTAGAQAAPAVSTINPTVKKSDNKKVLSCCVIS